VATEVVHEADHARYVVRVDGADAGVADYRDRGDALVFHHTEIDRARRGEGLGATLVRGALDDVRARGRAVVPTCWFVAEFVDLHPEYEDLLASHPDGARDGLVGEGSG
jgi:predicted GNAT family acetyltransferase